MESDQVRVQIRIALLSNFYLNTNADLYVVESEYKRISLNLDYHPDTHLI